MTDVVSKTDAKPHKVRKRNRWTRVYGKRRRPKTPASKTGWVLAELAQLMDLPESTIRYYMNEKLIRPSEFRGTITRYQRRELMRLVGIVRLKSEGKRTLAKIRHELDSMNESELESWLRSGPIPPAAAGVLGITGTALSADTAPTTVTMAPGVALASGPALVEQWQRIALLPGVDLMVRSDAGEAARGAVRRIVSEWVQYTLP